jgi:hypothetical protein
MCGGEFSISLLLNRQYKAAPTRIRAGKFEDKQMKPVLHAALAVAGLFSLAALPTQGALAADFQAQCLDASGGSMSKEECACLDDNVTDADRDAIAGLFKAAAKAKESGQQLSDSTPGVGDGIAAMQKYEAKCSKDKK